MVKQTRLTPARTFDGSRLAAWRMTVMLLGCSSIFGFSRLPAEAPSGQPPESHRGGPAKSIVEARARSRILHETIHGALQVMHRDFFDEENIHTIPSRSLEDVFLELERTYGVSLRWISVNAKALNVDHEPSDEFEKKAAQQLSSGEKEYETVEPACDDKPAKYRHVGAIRLASQCLKCHLPNRRSNQDRLAGLAITMDVLDDHTVVEDGR